MQISEYTLSHVIIFILDCTAYNVHTTVDIVVGH